MGWKYDSRAYLANFAECLQALIGGVRRGFEHFYHKVTTFERGAV
jgi:hypothetical protein